MNKKSYTVLVWSLFLLGLFLVVFLLMNHDSTEIIDTPSSTSAGTSTDDMDYEYSQLEPPTSSEIQEEKQDEVIFFKTEKELTIEWIQAESGLPEESCVLLFDLVNDHEHLSVPIMMAVYWTESRFDPNAINTKSNATGLAQFLPSSAEWLSSYLGIDYTYDKLFDPSFSINLSVKLLEYNLSVSGNNLSYSLDCYNGCEDGSYSSNILAISEDYSSELEQYINDNQEVVNYG